MILAIILIGTVLSLLFGILMYKFKYWQRKGVDSLKNNAFIGHWFQMRSMHHRTMVQELYDRFKKTKKVAGFYVYTQPIAVVLDMDLVKEILIKTFNKFTDRMPYKNDKDILSRHLFNVEGTRWRPLRNKLNSTFSSAKMRYMFPTIMVVAKELKETVDNQLAVQCILDITDLVARFTTDIIGTCAFGIQCQSLKDPQAECRNMVSKIVGRSDFNVRWQLFKQTYAYVFRFIGFKRYPQYMEDFFMRILRENVMERELRGLRRNDFIDILIDLKNTKDEEGNAGLTYNEIAAQIFAFFFAGYETSASVLTIALYALARHPEIQHRARQTIVSKLGEYNNELTYEATMELPYVDQIVLETLRLYPSISCLQRISVDQYNIPDTDIVLDKGTLVLIPVNAIHHDPDIYENPLEFRPERFHPTEVAKRHTQSFLGFGDGPRNCVGIRFGQMQARVGLVTLLSNYKFSICERTIDKFEYSNHTFVTKLLSNVWLKVEKLENN